MLTMTACPYIHLPNAIWGTCWAPSSHSGALVLGLLDLLLFSPNHWFINPWKGFWILWKVKAMYPLSGEINICKFYIHFQESTLTPWSLSLGHAHQTKILFLNAFHLSVSTLGLAPRALPLPAPFLFPPCFLWFVLHASVFNSPLLACLIN